MAHTTTSLQLILMTLKCHIEWNYNVKICTSCFNLSLYFLLSIVLCKSQLMFSVPSCTLSTASYFLSHYVFPIQIDPRRIEVKLHMALANFIYILLLLFLHTFSPFFHMDVYSLMRKKNAENCEHKWKWEREREKFWTSSWESSLCAIRVHLCMKGKKKRKGQTLIFA